MTPRKLVQRVIRKFWSWSAPKGYLINFDLPNLLTMFVESIGKIIDHLEHGRTQKALARALKTKAALEKVISHCIPSYHNGVERKL